MDVEKQRKNVIPPTRNGVPSSGDEKPKLHGKSNDFQT
jgi:hypothetical protein